MTKYTENQITEEVTINPSYNRHYILVDEQGRITDGWSDGPHPERDAADAICINEQGGYQFRLFPGGEENPTLFDWDGMIPLYKYENGEVICRTQEEIEADQTSLPISEVIPTAQDDTDAMLVDHEYRITLLELGLSEEVI